MKLIKPAIWTLIVAATLAISATAFANSKKAPVFSLPGMSQQVDLSAYKGQVVYVDFWASWCGPCRESFPWMNEMKKKYGDVGFEVIAINLDTEKDKVHGFLKDNKANFTIAFDPKGSVAEQYQVQGMPSSYLIDRKGNIVHTHIGFRENKKSEYEAQIRELIRH